MSPEQAAYRIFFHVASLPDDPGSTSPTRECDATCRTRTRTCHRPVSVPDSQQSFTGADRETTEDKPTANRAPAGEPVLRPQPARCAPARGIGCGTEVSPTRRRRSTPSPRAVRGVLAGRRQDRWQLRQREPVGRRRLDPFGFIGSRRHHSPSAVRPAARPSWPPRLACWWPLPRPLMDRHFPTRQCRAQDPWRRHCVPVIDSSIMA